MNLQRRGHEDMVRHCLGGDLIRENRQGHRDPLRRVRFGDTRQRSPRGVRHIDPGCQLQQAPERRIKCSVSGEVAAQRACRRTPGRGKANPEIAFVLLAMVNSVLVLPLIAIG